jgi:rod shape-determining protein MreD
MRPVSLKLIYFTLMVAFMLYLLPWAGFGLMLRPDFVLLVLLFWLLRAPQLCNVGTAWAMGLLIDLASGSLFGQHAMAYAMAGFFAIFYQRRLVLFTAWQQAGYVLLLLLLSQTTLLVIKLLAGNAPPGWGYFLPCLTGVLLWQILLFSRVIGADPKTPS